MTADPKIQAKPTATVSVCLTPAELDRVRIAARLSSLSVSAWGAARLAAALQTDKSREKVRTTAAIAGEDGEDRSARASMIVMGDAHAELRKRAVEMTLTAHAVAQAVFLAASSAEVDGASSDRVAAAREAVDAGVAIRAPKARPALAVSVPSELASLDPGALAKVVNALLDAAIVATFKGEGPKIAAGMARLAARIPEGERATLALPVDQDMLRAAALVLQTDAATMATALTIKAAKAL